MQGLPDEARVVVKDKSMVLSAFSRRNGKSHCSVQGEEY